MVTYIWYDMNSSIDSAIALLIYKVRAFCFCTINFFCNLLIFCQHMFITFTSFLYHWYFLVGCKWTPGEGWLGVGNKDASWSNTCRYVITFLVWYSNVSLLVVHVFVNYWYIDTLSHHYMLYFYYTFLLFFSKICTFIQ